MLEFLQANPWLLALAIFIARILDVSLGTVRTILVFRGKAYVAALIGFVEVLIWIVAASQVLSDLGAWYLAVAYAAGFAAGNIVGIWVESKMALGLELVRAVSQNLDVRLAARLRDAGYSVVHLDGMGDNASPVEIVFVVERRRRVGRLLRDIEAADPDAFCTISDVKRHHMLAMASADRRRGGGWRSVIKKK